MRGVECVDIHARFLEIVDQLVSVCCDLLRVEARQPKERRQDGFFGHIFKLFRNVLLRVSVKICNRGEGVLKVGEERCKKTTTP